MNTNTTRISVFVVLALISMLAFSGCSQKASSEENAKEHATATGKAAKAATSKQTAKSMHLAQVEPAPAGVTAPAKKTVCDNCGVVVSVKEIEQKGKGTGLGVIVGGVAGGLVGNQVGQGSGRDLATIAGLVGGAFAGNTVEEKIKKTIVYDVAVRLDNGEERVLRYKTVPGVMAGDKVKVENGRVVRL